MILLMMKIGRIKLTNCMSGHRIYHLMSWELYRRKRRLSTAGRISVSSYCINHKIDHFPVEVLKQTLETHCTINCTTAAHVSEYDRNRKKITVTGDKYCFITLLSYYWQRSQYCGRKQSCDKFCVAIFLSKN